MRNVGKMKIFGNVVPGFIDFRDVVPEKFSVMFLASLIVHDLLCLLYDLHEMADALVPDC